MKHLIAQVNVTEPVSGITNPALGNTYAGMTGVTFLQNLLPRLVTIALIVGSLIFFFMLVIGAIQWIYSGGDKQAVESARGRVMNALIGIVILFAVFAIVKFVEIFFKVSILTIDINSLIIQ